MGALPLAQALAAAAGGEGGALEELFRKLEGGGIGAGDVLQVCGGGMVLMMVLVVLLVVVMRK